MTAAALHRAFQSHSDAVAMQIWPRLKDPGFGPDAASLGGAIGEESELRPCSLLPRRSRQRNPGVIDRPTG